MKWTLPPAAVARIRAEQDKLVTRLRMRRPINALHGEAIDLDKVYGAAGKMCITCHK